MKTLAQKIIRHAAARLGAKVIDASDPRRYFHAFYYLRHTACRLEHLASLHLPVQGLRVLDVGAGIGDHARYYLDRGCQVTLTEPRPENIAMLRSRFPEADIRRQDLEAPGTGLENEMYDVTHCYGLLYHLQNPTDALGYLAKITRGMLLLETCVSFGAESSINVVSEPRHDLTQAFSGKGCRPTRPWIFDQLKQHFAHVYVPLTQPNHPEFPTDWTRPESHAAPLSRAVFIGSRIPLDNDQLTTSLPATQQRHP